MHYHPKYNFEGIYSHLPVSHYSNDVLLCDIHIGFTIVENTFHTTMLPYFLEQHINNPAQTGLDAKNEAPSHGNANGHHGGSLLVCLEHATTANYAN